jgi:hypothetical protein
MLYLLGAAPHFNIAFIAILLNVPGIGIGFGTHNLFV